LSRRNTTFGAFVGFVRSIRATDDRGGLKMTQEELATRVRTWGPALLAYMRVKRSINAYGYLGDPGPYDMLVRDWEATAGDTVARLRMRDDIFGNGGGVPSVDMSSDDLRTILYSLRGSQPI